MDDIDRLLDKVEVGDGCWNWTEGMTPQGYGAFRLFGRSMMAHRASWILHFGSIMNGLHVLHKCDNRKCIRPGHLELGDDRKNHEDAAKRRRLKTKLRHEDIPAIRAMRGAASARVVAGIYGVSREAISLVWNGRNWKHIPQ